MPTANDLPNSEPGNLWLIGMMGSGKTVVGQELARRAGLRFVDVDAEIVSRVGNSIAELWQDRGEEAFRDMEAAAIARLAHLTGHVIATGGGAVLRAGNVTVMRRSGMVVWLTAPAPVLAARLRGDTSRPLLADGDIPARLDAILRERSGRYAAAATHRIDTTRRDPAGIATALEDLWTGS